jgi:glycosyltransferase involved in cell wall biosynthesis
VKVLFITHSYPRTDGDAAGSFLLNLARALAGEGVEVRVVAPAGNDLPASEVLGGIPVERFRYAPRKYENLAYTGNMAGEVQRSLTAKFALVGFLGSEFAAATRLRRTFEPHLVHAHWWFPGGLVGTWVSALGNVPLVTTLHGSDVRLAGSTSLARPLFRHVLKQSRAVTAVSRWLASAAEEVMPQTTPIVAPMPVATELFRPNGARDGDRLLFVGRLNAQKGIESLLDAMSRMKTAAQLDVVGDGQALESLRERAGALGIGGRVHWHGALPQPQLPPLYQRASAVVMPSLAEGLGLVAVEAQLCEAPVVGFESGGLRDTIEHDHTGILVPPGDLDALARALDDVLLDRERAGAIGKAGRMAALARFAPESAARRYAELYRSIVGGQSS